MEDETKNLSQLNKRLSRRGFFKFSGQIFVGAGVCGILPGIFVLNDAIAAIPVSGGYLLVDSKKCQGCLSCMLVCSLAHEGVESLSLSRIQITQDSFGKFPSDLTVAQCRQCVKPACVEACPSGALSADSRYANIRKVDPQKCIGCKACVEACPYGPSRPVWNAEKRRAQICDLCAETPFWDRQGGPKGSRACVEICPVGALTFTTNVPNQKGDDGYQINLREENWKKLGYPVD